MPSTRELRRRIKSVKSTRQITRAMELMSSAKMRRASEATLASRPYASRIWEVVADIVGQPVDDIYHPLIKARPVKNSIVFIVSSDRGLAGAYNVNIVRGALEFLQKEKAEGRNVDFITMGRKVEAPLHRAGATVVQTYPHTPGHPSTADTQPISSFLTKSFLDGTYDAVYVLYTEFRSMMSQVVELRQILPLAALHAREDEHAAAHKAGVRFFIYEPGVSEALNYILPRLVDIELYQAIQESLASEHSARRIAMKNATDNASDMIDDLTLTYNGVRQGNITREIAEITSGAAALES